MASGPRRSSASRSPWAAPASSTPPRACSQWSRSLSDRASSVKQGAQQAQSVWEGSARSAFSGYASHLISVFTATSEAVGRAGSALTAFATELESAQRVTQQAYGSCQQAQSEYDTQSDAASTHASRVQSLTTQLAGAVTPPQSAELNRQLTAAQSDQQTAESAASQAQTALTGAQRQGQQAWNQYLQQAQSTTGTLQGLDGQLQKVQTLPKGPSASPSSSAAAATGNGFWTAFDDAAGSDITGGAIGLAQAIADRYRKTDLVLPVTERANKSLESWEEAFGDNSDDFVQRANGLWVGKGPSGDPLADEVRSVTAGPEWTTPGKGQLIPNADDLEGVMPTWAKGASTGLFVLVPASPSTRPVRANGSTTRRTIPTGRPPRRLLIPHRRPSLSAAPRSAAPILAPRPVAKSAQRAGWQSAP